MTRDKQGLEIMIAVLPFAEDAQSEIQLDISLENHLS